MADKELIEWLGALLALDSNGTELLLGATMLFKPEWFEDLF